MKNYTNIYDIDGEIIRKAGDNHKITIEEAQKMMEKYRQKLQDIDETDKKAVVYATYMRNLSNYILAQYATLSPDQINEILTANSDKNNTSEQVEKAINELKGELEEGTTMDTEVEQAVGESVVEDKPTIMDEYVDFTEV